MNLWMKGETDREVFTALSPMTEGLSRTPGMPYNIKEQPTLTFVARQKGEAWNRPFVAIYEPSSVKEPGCIAEVSFPEVKSKTENSATSICVVQKDGRIDYILSSDNPTDICTSGKMSAQATYALWGNKKGNDCAFFLGHGTLLSTPNVVIKAETPAEILLEFKKGAWYYTASADCSISIKKKTYKLKANTAEMELK